MPSIKKTVDKSGTVTYKVQVSNGRGRKVTRSWRPEPGWSARTTERELHKFAAQLENELADGTLKTRQEDLECKRQAELEAAKLKTVSQYANLVYMAQRDHSFSENTKASYTMYLNRHILPVLGDFLLTDVTPAMINKLLTDFQKDHAHASVIKMFNILSGIFKSALMDDTIERNPMDKVQRPKPRKGETGQSGEVQSYSVQEVKYILSCLENEPTKWRTYISVLIDTGIRRGECCGLMWEDVSWKDRTITIQRNCQYTPAAGVFITSPKNGRSRVVDVGEDTLNLLRKLQREQADTCISKFIFTQDNSPLPIHPQSPDRYFKRFGEKYGIENFHPHILRHTSASLAIVAGADVASVSERLGHSDKAVTLRMYTHSDQEAIRRAGETVRQLLKAESE